MNLTLKIVEREALSLTELLNALCFSNYKIQLDAEKNLLHIYDVTDEDVDKIKEIFNNHGHSFIIMPEDKKDLKTPQFSLSDLAMASSDFTEKSFLLNVQKILNMNSNKIEAALSTLMHTLHRMSTHYNFNNNILTNYINLMCNELKLITQYPAPHKVSLGDVVSCDLGMGIQQEPTGFITFALVCNEDATGQFFVLPIVKRNKYLSSDLAIELTTGTNITFNDTRHTGGFILLPRGKYINPKRVKGIVGKISDELLIQVLCELPHIYDFTHNLTHNIDEDSIPEIDNLDMDVPDDVIPVDTTVDVPASNENVAEVDVANTHEETKQVSEVNAADAPAEVTEIKNVSVKEKLFIGMFPEAIENLKHGKGMPGERVEKFMEAIGMPTTQKSVLCSFLISILQKKLSYDSIAKKLIAAYDFDEATPEQLVKELKSYFSIWIKQHPRLKENYPNISLPAVLSIFQKYYVP